MNVLPDLVSEGLKVIFCGTAAGERSANLAQFYVGPGNRFWEIIFDIGLTPCRLRSCEYPKLLDYDIGLTDLAKGIAGRDKNIPNSAFHREGSRSKIQRYAPMDPYLPTSHDSCHPSASALPPAAYVPADSDDAAVVGAVAWPIRR